MDIHAHEIMHMMLEHDEVFSRESLAQAIIERFGAGTRLTPAPLLLNTRKFLALWHLCYLQSVTPNLISINCGKPFKTGIRFST